MSYYVSMKNKAELLNLAHRIHRLESHASSLRPTLSLLFDMECEEEGKVTELATEARTALRALGKEIGRNRNELRTKLENL